MVEITAGRRTYFGTLIEDGIRDEDTGRYVVEINPKLAKFYGRTQWTQIDWEQRQRLRGKPLALWLHGFYASHAAPHALSVEYLHRLSGSQTKQLRYFKKNLAQALRDLEAAGAIKSFEIQSDLVYVRTVPSKSQRKHWPRAGLQFAGGNRHGIRATQARYTSHAGTVYEPRRHGIRATQRPSKFIKPVPFQPLIESVEIR